MFGKCETETSWPGDKMCRTLCGIQLYSLLQNTFVCEQPLSLRAAYEDGKK